LKEKKGIVSRFLIRTGFDAKGASMKKYQIIYADPPWSYDDKMKGHSFSLEEEYETQDIDWIKKLPIKDIALDNSVLFLWAVSPLLPEALEVINAWGFKYKTLAFCWSKIERGGAWVSNLGRWTMGNVELCLLATKGSPKRIKENIKQLVVDVRTEHSKKPDIVRSRIVELMGDIPRIELFARGDRDKDLFGKNRYDGWDVWGNEVESDISFGAR
jgi:N6-adenosine-specific RNA methylase IME4